MAFPELPAPLLEGSRQAGNGERAWSVGRVEDVAAWLLDHGRELGGGEVYELVGEVQWGSFHSDWETEPPWDPGCEEWAQYRRRALAQLQAALAACVPEPSRFRVYLAAYPRRPSAGEN